jgi:hypothetical protein
MERGLERRLSRRAASLAAYDPCACSAFGGVAALAQAVDARSVDFDQLNGC